MNNEEVREYGRRHFQELYELLLELARIPAPTGDESRRAAFCCGWLRCQGLKDSYTDEAGNVVWPYRVREGCPVLVFMAHMDVVFPDTEPLPLYERDGKIFCPGIGDDCAGSFHAV